MNVRVTVNDRMQRGYVYYRTEPIGRNFAPGFQPELTPQRAIRRHVAQIVSNCDTGDLDCRRRQRQAVLHWAYDSRKL